MPERARIPLTFGDGLDRATGKTLVRPGTMRDLRNVYLYEGKVQVRRGMEEIEQYLDEGGSPVTDILAIHSLRASVESLVVAYSSNNGRVYIYRADAEGRGGTLLESELGQKFWFEQSPSDPVPVVLVAESFDRVFFAHSEGHIMRRARTVYYDPTFGQPIRSLKADLDNSGTEVDVYFRGVATHQDYLLGWGYGTGSDRNRPEVVRASLPGEPTKFLPNHYWLVGQSNDPVRNVISVGRVAVALKGHELHALTGYDRATFGVQPLDPEFGVAGDRLAIKYGGLCLFWDETGPRVTDGLSPSRDIGDRLDLAGFQPSDLLPACEGGFAMVRPERKIVEFVFGEFGYALSFQSPENPKWSYQEYPFPLNCAGLLYDADSAGISAPEGFPICVASADWGDGSLQDTSVIATVSHNNPPQGGFLEVFVRVNGAGSWPAVPTKAVAIQFSTSNLQQVGIDGLTALTTYDLAWRYRVGNKYTPGYESSNPDNWSASAKSNSHCIAAFTTTAPMGNIVSSVWQRTGASTEIITITWDGVAPSDSIEVEVSTDNQSFTPIAGSPFAPGTTFANYTVPTGEMYYFFRIKPAGGNYSNSFKAWAGPARPLGYIEHYRVPPIGTAADDYPPAASARPYLFWVKANAPPFTDNTKALVDIYWATSNTALPVEIWARNGTNPYALVTTVPDSTPARALSVTVPRNSGPTFIKIRHKQTSFSVDDFSDFTPEKKVVNEMGSVGSF